VLTIAYITARTQCKIDWFFDSLRLQRCDIVKQIIVVDYFAQACDAWTEEDVERRRAEVFKMAGDFAGIVEWVPPKPNVWAGKHRITAVPWWHVSACRNTALCLARGDFVVFLDDRCVLAPTWLQAVRDAMAGQYAVCGSYSKWHGVAVENGVITDPGTFDSRDARDDGKGIRNCFGSFWGGTYGMPLEWALAINGWCESVDGLGAEDYICGAMLVNSGYVTKYDPALRIIEDRTPGEIGPVMKKTDKGVSPSDKSHAALTRFGSLKRCEHQGNMREIREAVLRGEPFPIPTGPVADWWDQQPLSEM
jgi:hypothetical protein